MSHDNNVNNETKMLSNLRSVDSKWNDCGCGMYMGDVGYSLQYFADGRKLEGKQKSFAQIRIQCARFKIQAILKNVPMKLNELTTN